jgi:hypothetical protein
MAMCNGPAGPHISVTSSGVNGAEVDHVVMSHGGALRACCERAAMTTTNLRGELTFGWVIEADGTVSNVTLTDTTVRIPPLESCALRQVESWHFPQRAVQTRVSGFPFRFGPGV